MGHPSPPPSLATLRFGQASDGGSEGMAQPDPMIEFAELDAHNSFTGLGKPLEAVRDVKLFALPSQEPFPIFVRRYAELTTKGASQPLLISKPGLPRYPL